MKQRTRTFSAMSVGLVAVGAIAAAGVTGMTTSAADVPDHAAHGSEHMTGPSPDNENVQHALAHVRRVTDRFHDLDTAIAGFRTGSAASGRFSSR